MWSEYIRSFSVILPVTFISAVLVLVQPQRMAAAYKGSLVAVAGGYLAGGLIFGWMAILAYHWIATRWPAGPAQAYLYIALGLTAVFTVMALVMLPVVKNGWVVTTWIVLNLIWGLGYGWFLPRLLA
ncbi:MAG: hypothetical protein GYA17_02885 [Chloroflexi bacterium]|nr:hypothetical protein [Chloroflexota bacterium]